ncbi:uncharacterized protein SPSC_00478 [Sporisorium scitamineum]|uniref:Uncharacterized protein n=1 Tax=Sporisorium scitamineum TaxID=49012 RepID=A0A140KMM1_9BASI|nr:uncharacterized protein SPSC_00478 [Sporisorium scitamineum]
MVITRSSTSSTPATTSTSTHRTKFKPSSTAWTPSRGSTKFPYTLPYPHLCLRTHPSLYRTGLGEQGVLMVEPYKSELLPHWKFKNPPTATASSSKLYRIFLTYLSEDDFMGYTRARRYANHKGGKKYIYDDNKGGKKRKRREIARLEVEDQDPEKVEAARTFKQVLDEQVWTNEKYVKMREEHLEWAKMQPLLTEDSQEVQEAILKDPQKQRVVRKW